jgi:hypothetical protein
MAAATDTLNPPPVPQRVYYSTGRMLAVEDFQADQDYHRGRLARALVQLYGTGTVSGLLVQTDGNTDTAKLELQVTAGIAIDRVGRIIEVPRTVCIVLNDWFTQVKNAWNSQITNPQPGQAAVPDPNLAIRDGKNLMCDVFATFIPCTRGLTPCFAADDDYDATDAFKANRWLDSCAMQLVLRTDINPPLTPADPWKSAGPLPAGGAGLTAANEAAMQNLLLSGTAGPGATAVEYPPDFDISSVFLARVLIAATKGTSGQAPTPDFSKIAIDNNSRLFVYPAALLARLAGLGSGAES